MKATRPAAIGGPDDARFTGKLEVNRVAEVHHHLRHRLRSSLEATALSDEIREVLGTTAGTYLQYWHETFGDRYFDMATLQRLASAVETGLRHHHAALAGVQRAREVAADNSRRGVFQALVHPANLLQLYRVDCGYDLEDNPSWETMRELVVHRHLYAHRSGVIDEKYLTDLQRVTSEDLRPAVTAKGYPHKAVLWFEPLSRLESLIEAARSFFLCLPTDQVPVPSRN